MTFKVMDEEPNAPFSRPLPQPTAAFWAERQLKCRRSVGPLVGIKLVRGIKSALIKRGRKSRSGRERGRNLSSSFIAQDSVEQFAVEQKSIIHYNAMRA